MKVPEAPFLNGLTTLSASRGLLLASASLDGKIWLIDAQKRTSRVLVEGEAFEAPANATYSGVNGVRVLPTSGRGSWEHGHGGYGKDKDVKEVYFSNQGAATFSRFSVNMKTLKTSKPEIVHRGMVIDDFALDAEKGIAWVAGRENEVVKIPLYGGQAEVVYGGLNEAKLAGPTSVVLGRGRNEKGKIFVSTNGGLNGPVNGVFVEGGKVVELDVGC